MNKLPLLLVIGLASCSRHSSPGSDNNCISRYSSITNSMVRPGQLDTIEAYFQKNHLSIAHLQFLYLNEFPGQDGHYIGPIYQVGAGLILNGLRVPSVNMNFIFDSVGILLDSAGGYAGQLPDNDTSGHRSLEDLRQLFLANYKQCIIEGGPANAKPLQATAPYDDTCLRAELVYVDAASQYTNAPLGQQLVKGWLVTSADYSYFPEVTVIDNTGQAIPLKLYIP